MNGQKTGCMRIAFGCLVAMVFVANPWDQLAAKDLERWDALIVAGWVEPIYLGETKIPITAKLDTGAKASSFSALDLKTEIAIAYF